MELKAATNILLMYAVTDGVSTLCREIDDPRTVRVTVMPCADGGDAHAFHLSLPNGDERVVTLAFNGNKLTAEGEYTYPTLTFGGLITGEMEHEWWDIWRQPQLVAGVESIDDIVNFLAPIIMDYLWDNWVPSEAIRTDELHESY